MRTLETGLMNSPGSRCYAPPHKGARMKLSVKGLALASGILWGASIFLATLWLLARGYDGRLITQLNHFYIGYSYSVVGAFMGLVWGFVDGAVCGAIFAWLYNKLAKA
jgi:hypothetical protein